MLRRNIGCVFQDFKLLTDRTAYENVAYALKVQGQSKAQIRAKVPEILALVGLGSKMNSFPHELSGGEQQRVSIARAFVNHPPLLICDEPTGNLDPDTSVGIMQLLYRINRTGTTVVMATHDREMVDKMRKRVIALEDGVVIRDERRGGYGCVRAKLFFSEALRSMAANISTSVAAVMTVLIGMFLLGLFIALGSWVISWTNHVKKELVVNVYFCTELTCGKEATQSRSTPSARELDQNPEVKSYKFVSKDEAWAEMQERFPELVEGPSEPAPAVLRGHPERRRQRAGDRRPPPARRRPGSRRSSTARRRRSACSRWRRSSEPSSSSAASSSSSPRRS